MVRQAIFPVADTPTRLEAFGASLSEEILYPKSPDAFVNQRDVLKVGGCTTVYVLFPRVTTDTQR